jgi:hypothetical protein
MLRRLAADPYSDGAIIVILVGWRSSASLASFGASLLPTPAAGAHVEDAISVSAAGRGDD